MLQAATHLRLRGQLKRGLEELDSGGGRGEGRDGRRQGQRALAVLVTRGGRAVPGIVETAQLGQEVGQLLGTRASLRRPAAPPGQLLCSVPRCRGRRKPKEGKWEPEEAWTPASALSRSSPPLERAWQGKPRRFDSLHSISIEGISQEIGIRE